jgi:hypothetical protein
MGAITHAPPSRTNAFEIVAHSNGARHRTTATMAAVEHATALRCPSRRSASSINNVGLHASMTRKTAPARRWRSSGRNTSSYHVERRGFSAAFTGDVNAS